MKLSIIIPTRNRAHFLRVTLESILIQTLPQNKFEVIVVDNGSEDETKKVVEYYITKIKNLVYLYDDTPGLHIGRHKGLLAARTNILVYADDDIEPFPTWLEGILDSFESYDVAIVGGKILPKFEEDPPGWILDLWNKNNMIPYLSIIDMGDEVKYIDPLYIFGCNFSILKEVLIEAGGFHPDGMPENLIKYRGDGETHVSSFIKKSGYKTIYNPKASVYHFVSKERMTKEYFAKRAFNQGISDSYTDVRNGFKRSLFKFRMKIFIKKYFFRHDVFFEENYLKGYQYHQNEVKNDKKLEEWIKKENYITDGTILT